MRPKYRSTKVQIDNHWSAWKEGSRSKCSRENSLGELTRSYTENDLENDEDNDDDLEPLRVARRDLVLEQLQHVLQHFDTRVKQVDALRNLEVGTRGRIERLCAIESRCQPDASAQWSEGRSPRSGCAQKISGESTMEPTRWMFIRRINS